MKAMHGEKVNNELDKSDQLTMSKQNEQLILTSEEAFFLAFGLGKLNV